MLVKNTFEGNLNSDKWFKYALSSTNTDSNYSFLPAIDHNCFLITPQDYEPS